MDMNEFKIIGMKHDEKTLSYSLPFLGMILLLLGIGIAICFSLPNRKTGEIDVDCLQIEI